MLGRNESALRQARYAGTRAALHLDLFHDEHLEDVALLDVLVLIHRNAARPTGCPIPQGPQIFYARAE